MKTHLFRLIAKGLIIIGLPLFLFHSYAVFRVVTYTGEYGPLPSDVVLLPVFLLLDFSIISIGVIILRRYLESLPFLTRDGEPIHSGKSWKKGSEQGLFLTSCGLVVSINQESGSTTHVGYKIITAKRATHRECILKEGGEVLDRFAKRRSW